jgi:1-acyl-sn-glycerol-3-phosphate acyltransferase
MSGTPDVAPDAQRFPIGRFQRQAEFSAEQRRAHIARLAAQPADLAAVMSGLTASDYAAPYRDGGWTVRQLVHHMADSLRAGQVLAVFPEGTTSDGVSLLPFHANLLQAAIVADAPVQPVALGYIDSTTGQRSLAPCYIGDDTLVGSVWRMVMSTPITVTLNYGAPQSSDGRDRRAWATDLRAAIEDLRADAPMRQPLQQLESVA